MGQDHMATMAMKSSTISHTACYTSGQKVLSSVEWQWIFRVSGKSLSQYYLAMPGIKPAISCLQNMFSQSP